MYRDMIKVVLYTFCNRFPDDKAGVVLIAYVVCLVQSSLIEKNVQKFISNRVLQETDNNIFIVKALGKRIHTLFLSFIIFFDVIRYTRWLRRVTFVKDVPKSAFGKILRRKFTTKIKAKL